MIAIAIALSFIATLAPIAGASASKSMACCAGKAAGHCDSGLAAKEPPAPKEPMCGLHAGTAEDDGITVVAEPVAESQHSHGQTSTQPAAESASLSQPCHMDCGACATGSTRQQNRERSIVLPNAYQAASVTTSSRYEDNSLLFSSSENWPHVNPRGPPARR
ncbi:MAG TPA: hypothetical protein VI031_06325 [Pyrinomonadaceae bacterium]